MSTETSLLRPGLRLSSQVCSTEIIVVRAGSRPVTLCCGGVPMVERGAEPAGDATPAADRMGGSLIGKRYSHPEDSALEVLVTAPGQGSLSDGEHDLVIKEAKPLPASD